jgi:cytoskeletal protein RodZ
LIRWIRKVSDADRSCGKIKTHMQQDLKEIGEVLEAARRKKGFTIEKVYKETRIQPNVIEALEKGKAEELLDRIYIIMLLRKYASFLNLDGAALAARYRAFYEANKGDALEEIKKSPALGIELQKWVKPEIYSAIVFVLIFLILLFGIKTRFSRDTGQVPKTAQARPQAALAKTPPSTSDRSKGKPDSVKKETRAAAAKPSASPATPEKTASKNTGRDAKAALFPIPKDVPIELALRGADEVWMKVKQDGRVIFEGTLRRNEQKKWAADKVLDLWVGRAEALDFTINGTRIGKVGSGRIKDIQILRNGLKIDNTWLLKAEE